MLYNQPQSYLLLLAWLVTHIWVVYGLLCVIDTDISRQWLSIGWAALQPLATLLFTNTLLYCATYNFSRDRIQSSKLSEVDADDSIFSSPLLAAVGTAHRLTPASISKQLRNGQQPLIISVLAADVLEGNDVAPDLPWSKQCTCANFDRRHGIRTHYCRCCARCVDGFDHHCHWLGGCIGRHNHQRFYLYLATQTTLFLYVLHQALTAARQAAHTAWSWQHVMTAVFVVLLLMASIMMGAMLGFHTFLILANWKTYEVMKGPSLPHIKVGDKSPFNRGVLRNLYNFMFDPELYDTLVDDWHAGGSGAEHGEVESFWDNSLYSCC